MTIQRRKILRRTHPSRAFFFFHHFGVFMMYFGIMVALILMGIFLYREFIAFYHLAAIFALLAYGFHFRFLHKNTRYIFTSRRLFFIQKSLFKRHYNEIHITDLRQAIPKKSGLLGMIFGYGTLILIDKDEKKITYSSIHEQ